MKMPRHTSNTGSVAVLAFSVSSRDVQSCFATSQTEPHLLQLSNNENNHSLAVIFDTWQNRVAHGKTKPGASTMVAPGKFVLWRMCISSFYSFRFYQVHAQPYCASSLCFSSGVIRLILAFTSASSCSIAASWSALSFCSCCRRLLASAFSCCSSSIIKYRS